MRQLYIILFFIFTLYSCSEYSKNVNTHHEDCETLKYELVDSFSIEFPLDSITSHIFTALEYNDEWGVLSFLSNRRILMYDYEKKKLINTINIQCSSPSSYTVINRDSILVIDYNERNLMIYGDKGNILNSYKLFPSIKYAPLPINRISPIILKNNIVTFLGSMAGEYSDENEMNRKTMATFNLQTGEINYYMPYSDVYKENWGGGLYRWVYSDYNEFLDLYIISFPAEHYIYTLSGNKKELHKYYAGSQLIDATYYLNRSKDIPVASDLKIKHFVENHSYSRILYDKYRNVYYRIAEIKSTYEGIPGWQKEISVIILNDKFQIIGETFIGKPNLNSRYAVFVNESGLHIPQKSDENVLKYKLFVLCVK